MLLSEKREGRVMNVLVIEHERKVTLALDKGWRSGRSGGEVALADEEKFFCFCLRTFGLIILDLMLPSSA